MIKKILFLIADYNHKKIYYLLIGILLISILEMLSIGALLPIISSLAAEDTSQILFYQIIQRYFRFENVEEFVVFFCLVIALIFIIKFIITSAVTFYSNNVLVDIKQFISQKLISRYTNQSYIWHSSNNKNYFINLLINETSTYSLSTLRTMVHLIIDLSILIVIILILFLINIQLFVYIFFLSIIIFFFINKFSKKFSYVYGAERLKMTNNLLKHLNESLTGIKEIILYSKEKFISKIFLENSLKVSKSLSRHLNSMEIIKYAIELIGVFLVLAIVLNGLFDPKIAKKEIIETLGIYIIALIKLLPIFNRISTFTQIIRNGLVSAEKIKLFLDTTDPIIYPKINIDFYETIEFKNISYKYPNQKKLILKNIDFKIKKNEVVGIIGKSGEGKTTLTNILMGLIRPSSGNIYIDGKDMVKNNLSISHKTSFLSQTFFSIDANIPDNITLSDQKINFSDLRYSLRNSLLNKDIANKKLSLKTQLGESVKNLSGGQLQKINIARALYRKPKFLIMDEPTSSFDGQNQKDLNKIILKLKEHMTIIIISHNLEFLINFDKVYELKDNSIKLIMSKK